MSKLKKKQDNKEIIKHVCQTIYKPSNIFFFVCVNEARMTKGILKLCHEKNKGMENIMKRKYFT